MISFIRASKPLMQIVCEIINSNMGLYKGIMEDPHDINDYFVNEDWITKNFQKREFYVLKDQQKYVAMASFQILKNFGYVGYLHVRFANFGRGYGSTILKFLEIRAKRDNIAKIRLFTHPKATWAINFYKKHGYHIIETDQAKIDKFEKGILAPYHGKAHILQEKLL